MATKYVKCSLCTNQIPTSAEGWYYIDDSKTTTKECDCHIAWRNENVLIIQGKKNNIVMDRFTDENNPFVTYKGNKSDEVPKKLQFIVDNIGDPRVRKSSLYLYGRVHTQKTYLIQWVGASLVRKGLSVYYDRMAKVLDSGVTRSFDVEKIASVKSYLKKLMSVDILILDDFMVDGKATYYDYQSSHIDSVVRERIEAEKPIYFVSDVRPLDNTTKGFGESTKKFIDTNIRKTNTYLHCQDVWEAIDGFEDIFPKGLT